MHIFVIYRNKSPEPKDLEENLKVLFKDLEEYFWGNSKQLKRTYGLSLNSGTKNPIPMYLIPERDLRYLLGYLSFEEKSIVFKVEEREYLLAWSYEIYPYLDTISDLRKVGLILVF